LPACACAPPAAANLTNQQAAIARQPIPIASRTPAVKGVPAGLINTPQSTVTGRPA
jgi:hypothetical protein